MNERIASRSTSGVEAGVAVLRAKGIVGDRVSSEIGMRLEAGASGVDR